MKLHETLQAIAALIPHVVQQEAEGIDVDNALIVLRTDDGKHVFVWEGGKGSFSRLPDNVPPEEHLSVALAVSQKVEDMYADAVQHRMQADKRKHLSLVPTNTEGETCPEKKDGKK
ncbi:MAG: hypothetical protein CMK74_05995 [Pseudomonadales bacterium]|nr:hypothetical protein [Pseudomonadales bacterium]|tara:strand:+ start:2205 stop:2552 length:348 start_codon:yes stop_codon:yes gene_type:complete